MANSIELIARALIRHEDHVLVCRARRGYYYLPGGHVEFSEPARVALKRELFEETGLECRVGAFVAACENLFDGRHELNLVYLTDILFHVEPGIRPYVRSRESDISFHWQPLPTTILPKPLRDWLAAGAHPGQFMG